MKKCSFVNRFLIIVAAWVLGCSGASSNTTGTGSSDSVPGEDNSSASSDVAADSSNANAGENDGGDGDDDADESPAGANELCNGKTCASGESCIEYVGFTGQPLYTCGVPCKQGEPNDGCPDDMTCQISPDGPTLCVKR